MTELVCLLPIALQDTLVGELKIWPVQVFLTCGVCPPEGASIISNKSMGKFGFFLIILIIPCTIMQDSIELRIDAGVELLLNVFPLKLTSFWIYETPYLCPIKCTLSVCEASQVGMLLTTFSMAQCMAYDSAEVVQAYRLNFQKIGHYILLLHDQQRHDFVLQMGITTRVRPMQNII